MQDEAALALLADAAIDVEGRMPWSSNATFLVNLREPGDHAPEDGELLAQAIYKPERGERPLWDFPSGLYRREVAAYRLWAALGWTEVVGGGGVPPTIVRDGPYGIGSLQLFIPSDFQQHYFTIREAGEQHDEQLMAIGAFDLIANNTDRKSGHCLLGLDDNIWAIDNGLCFAAEWKLRTVIWEFAKQRLPEALLPGLACVAAEVPAEVAELLDDDENEAVRARAARLLSRPVFPTDPTGRRYPWPMV